MMQRLFILLFILCLACKTATNKTETNDSQIEETNTEGEISKEFYDEGGLKSEGPLVDGKRNGLWTSYFPNGTIWSQSNYKLNVLHGNTKVYYPTGVLRYKGKFRDGKRVGKWIEYLEDGKVDFIKEYPG